MLTKVAKKIFGTANDRYLKKLQPTLVRVNEFEEQLEKLDDSALVAQTARFRERLDNGEPLVGQPKFSLGDRYLSSAVFSRNIETLCEYLAAH